jgi:hypothetical protein
VKADELHNLGMLIIEEIKVFYEEEPSLMKRQSVLIHRLRIGVVEEAHAHEQGYRDLMS